MFKIILLVGVLSLGLFAGGGFSKSKKILLNDVYKDHKVTFYCDNPYEIKRVKNKFKALIVSDSSKYTPRHVRTKKGKLNIRATRVEWEHVVPAENFGRQFKSWYEGDPRCVSKKGKHFKGRKCAKKVSKAFRIMEADMMNLVPAIGEVNADRSNFKYGDEAANKNHTQYGECKFRVDFKARRAYVAESKRGFIARTYLYFANKHGMKLSKKDRKRFQAWDKMYPADSWEIERKKRIEAIQG